MCTVVLGPGRALALRDELVGREFDDPGAWWPDQPTVVGGRDRSAGGTWCCTDVASGRTAFVLNRPQKRVADEGAVSRGVLPLLAVARGARWAEHVELTGMASFALVHDGGVDVWDGAALTREPLVGGVAMVTSGAAEDGKVQRHLASFMASDDWPVLLGPPADDPTALVVRHAVPGGGTWATVFAQELHAEPGRLVLTSSRTPADPSSWLSATWTVVDGRAVSA